jgi:hypothetical protein
MNSNFEEFRKAVKEKIDFDSWAGTRKCRDGGLWINFFLPFGDINELTLEEKKDITKNHLTLYKKNKLARNHRKRRYSRYIFSNKDALSEGRVLIRVVECNSVIEAHEVLIDIVMTFMATTLPRCETHGLHIGDVCFGSYGNVPSSIIFTRYNIIVEARSIGFKDLPVDKITEKIDFFIHSDPEESKGYKELKPVIREFTISNEVTKVDGEIFIKLKVLDPRNREVMMKVVGTGGNILRRGDKIVYHAEKQGKQAIRVFAMNEDGYVTKREHKLFVE